MNEHDAHRTIHRLTDSEQLAEVRARRRQRRIDDLAGFLGFSPDVLADALERVVTDDRTLKQRRMRGAA